MQPSKDLEITSEHPLRTFRHVPAALAPAGAPRLTLTVPPATLRPWFEDARRIRAPRGFVEATLLAIRSVAARQQAPSDTGSPPPGEPTNTGGGSSTASDPSTSGTVTISMEDLIREHSDAVYRVALSVTRDAALAEDVSQDALIKAWTALPSFRGDAPLRNWVLRITHNTAISALRRRREELRDPAELPERESRSSVESQVQDRLAIDRFEDALADLDSVSRSIIVLREVEGLSYGELCDVLDLPMPTVKTRLLRARRQLAQALDGWQP